MNFNARFFFAFSVLSLSLGCSAADDSQGNDDEVAVDDEAALSTASNYGYFVVTRRDFRRCISPICGGYFVKRVNADTTRCADGSMQAECYVSSIELRGVGLSTREEDEARAAVESGKGLIKARMYKKNFNRVPIGTLKASEAWVGATGSAADGTFFRAANNGIVCIKAPCPTVTAYTLNDRDQQNVIDVVLDQTQTPADQSALDRAAQALGGKDGILVAGSLLLPKCMPNAPACGPKVVASEFYLRVTHTEGRACGGRGMGMCNATQYCAFTPQAICGRADASGTCSYKPEICNKLFAPVCGCDGNTYGNACEASAAGTSVSATGACL